MAVTRDGGTGGGREVEGHMPRIETDLSFRVLSRQAFEAGDNGVQAGDNGGDMQGGEGMNDVGEDGDEERVGGMKQEEELDDENDRAIWLEAFGEDMPDEVLSEPWMDMDAITDKRMREEFMSSIGSFAILWSVLSDWVTHETRSVCRAAREAVQESKNAASTPAEEKAARGVGSVGASGQGAGAPAPGTAVATARAAAAAAAAAAAEKALGAWAPGEGVGSGGVSLTVAQRHSGISTMINMHLGPAERELQGGAGGGSGDRACGGTSGSRRGTGDVRVGGIKTVKGAGRGSVECRRAMAAVIETFDVSSEGPRLSTEQWKVVPLVLLSAVGLDRGGGACLAEGHGLTVREFEMLCQLFLEA
ncbi:unnamed protein product [Discosporangium mesarthrocarpum]